MMVVGPLRVPPRRPRLMGQQDQSPGGKTSNQSAGVSMKDKYFNSDLVLKSSPILRSAALAGLIILAGAVGLQADGGGGSSGGSGDGGDGGGGGGGARG